MASTTLHDDIAAFLDDAVATLTNLHVKAAQYSGQPDVQAAFGDLASVPGALIEQAQQLRARLESAPDVKADVTINERQVAQATSKR